MGALGDAKRRVRIGSRNVLRAAGSLVAGVGIESRSALGW